MFKIFAVFILFVSANVQAMVGPDQQILQSFQDHPEVQAIVNSYLRVGFVISRPAQATLIYGICLPENSDGSAGRCIERYMVTQAFIRPGASGQPIVAAMITTDSYSGLLGDKSLAQIRVVPNEELVALERLLFGPVDLRAMLSRELGARSLAARGCQQILE